MVRRQTEPVRIAVGADAAVFHDRRFQVAQTLHPAEGIDPRQAREPVGMRGVV